VSWLLVRSFCRFLGWCISHQQDSTIFLYCSTIVLISPQYKNKKKDQALAEANYFISKNCF
jgi:hypothetical protein